jgi:flagellar hook assembly protein FlgD
MTPTYTATPTYTDTDTGTATSTMTETFTPTPTYTISQTSTVTFTQTPTSSITPTLSASLTGTISSTQTPTSSITPTYTISPTITITPTPDYNDIIVYPNPYSPSKAVQGALKIINLPVGANICIYTISGELVISIAAQAPAVYWNGRNSNGNPISPGIYYYTIKWSSNILKTGNIFVVH